MTDTNTLLTAVDALTKPFALIRYTGQGHDHEWKRLTRPPTPEEKAAWKAAKKPVRSKVDTDQWWCEHCETAVTERPEPTSVRRIDRRDELPLLEQLQEAVTSNIGGNGAGQLAHTRTPFDVGALTLLEAIDERVRAWMMDLGARPGHDLTTVWLLRAWFRMRGGVTPDDDRYTTVLTGWKTAILDILDPPQQIAYMGQPCPLCNNTRARIIVAGDVEDTVALWAFLRPEYREEGSFGMCKACRQVIATDTDPLRLRARMNGAIKPATHLTQKVADSA